MKLSELAERLNLKIAAGADNLDKDVKGCYIGDLMSLAMTGVGVGNVWITIQTNVNVVAVAALSEAACVILAEGFMPDENAAKKADSQGVVILSSEKTAYELAKALGDMGI